MKKTLCLLLAGLLVFSLLSCSGAGEQTTAQESAAPTEEAAAEVGESGADAQTQDTAENQVPAEPEPAAPARIADDTTALNLGFTPPEGYEKVNRHFEYDTDGSVVDESFTYTFADGAEVIIGNTRNAQITDEIPQSYLDEAEVVEYMGKPFYIITTDSSVMSMCQDGDGVYGIGWSFSDTIDREAFDHLMEGIRANDSTETDSNGEDLFDIRYTLDDSLSVAQRISNLTETPDGQVLDKSMSWYIGQDKENLDFRILIKVFRNAVIDDVKSTYGTPGELERNGVSYTVLYTEDNSEQPYVYYTQHGEDVYEIRNMGVSDGWTTSRSEESFAALDALMDTVSFD